jgi:hypothetical protein
MRQSSVIDPMPDRDPLVPVEDVARHHQNDRGGGGATHR